MFSGILVLGILLFLPARTFQYPGAWRMMAILFIPMLLLGAILLFKSSQLLEKRLSMKEEEILEKGLKGYKEYKQKVKYRLIPFVW